MKKKRTKKKPSPTLPHQIPGRKKALLQAIFHTLYAKYGPQHWWPGSSPFEVAVGAILTQNTSWKNVERAIANLKDHGSLSPPAIHGISAAKLGQLIRSSGFFNIKAVRLKEFVTFLMEQYDGTIEHMRHKRRGSLRKELLGIKGIGPETCDSIMLYAVGKPVFVVDGYARRILSRHGIIRKDASYDEIQMLFESSIKKSAKWYNEYHALLVRLAKEHCRAGDPECTGCPLKRVVIMPHGRAEFPEDSDPAV